MPPEKHPGRTTTVLIAIYKAGKYLESKIKNIKQQTLFDDCNIILLNCQNLENEKSTYQEFLENHDNVYEIYYGEYVRLYSSWNDGIKLINSEFICNSNVDDNWHPKYVEECVKFLKENKECACVSARAVITGLPNQYDHKTWKYEHQMPPGTYPTTTAGPCPMWRRELHEKYGYFDNYRTIGDAKLWEKWYKGGEKFGHINSNLVLYYCNSISLERRIDPISKKSLKQLDLDDTALKGSL